MLLLGNSGPGLHANLWPGEFPLIMMLIHLPLVLWVALSLCPPACWNKPWTSSLLRLGLLGSREGGNPLCSLKLGEVLGFLPSAMVSSLHLCNLLEFRTQRRGRRLQKLPLLVTSLHPGHHLLQHQSRPCKQLEPSLELPLPSYLGTSLWLIPLLPPPQQCPHD